MTHATPPASLSDDQTRQLLVYLAAAHMAGGAAAHEVREDVMAAGRALGHDAVQVNSTPNGITLSLGNGRPATFEMVESQLRLDQTARVAAVQYGIESGQLSPSEALDALLASRSKPARFPVLGMYFGGVIIAMGIAAILQPSVSSILFGAVVSPITVALIRLARRRLVPGALLPLIAAFLIATAAFTAFHFGLIVSPLRTMLPPLAVLLPGGLIVTGLAELVAGAMVSGASRLAYGATQLVLFAAGVAGAALALGVPAEAYANTRADDLGPLAGFIGLIGLTAGICLQESVPRALAPGVFVITALTYATQWGVQNVWGTAWSGALVGAFVASFCAWMWAWLHPENPRLVLFLPSFWLLVPGSLGLVSVTQLSVNPHESWATALNAASIIISIALGLVFGTTVARFVRRRVLIRLRTVRLRAR